MENSKDDDLFVDGENLRPVIEQYQNGSKSKLISYIDYRISSHHPSNSRELDQFVQEVKEIAERKNDKKTLRRINDLGQRISEKSGIGDTQNSATTIETIFIAWETIERASSDSLRDSAVGDAVDFIEKTKDFSNVLYILNRIEKFDGNTRARIGGQFVALVEQNVIKEINPHKSGLFHGFTYITDNDGWKSHFKHDDYDKYLQLKKKFYI